MSIADHLELAEYSEKACAVFGNTREFKDDLKRMGGKFNMKLLKQWFIKGFIELGINAGRQYLNKAALHGL